MSAVFAACAYRRHCAWHSGALPLAISPLFAHELQAVNPYDSVVDVTEALLGIFAALAASFRIQIPKVV